GAARHGCRLLYSGSAPNPLPLGINAPVRASSRILVVSVASNALSAAKEYHYYEILNELSFDSHRKAMSVTVHDMVTGRVMLVTKGADTSLCGMTQDEGARRSVMSAATSFAELGLRTLVYGVRNMTMQEAHQHSLTLRHSMSGIGRARERQMSKAYSAIETGLSLIGVTAVEDKLAPNVPQTIEWILRTGINMWVLT
ncbi:P-type ATPase, subfamily IV, partial [Kipferlia bialata]